MSVAGGARAGSEARAVLSVEQLSELLALIRAEGYDVVGPTVSGGAIVPAPISGLDDLPRGVRDEQSPGHYRLRERGDDALFGFAAAAQSAKRSLFVPRAPLVQIRRKEGALSFEQPEPPRGKLALFGVRPCDVAAIAAQDRVLLQQHQDPDYAARRAGALIVVVHCGDPASTCFCTSMGSGPRARAGFDLAAFELLGPPHRFLFEAGSPAGRALLERVPSAPVEPADEAAAEAVTRGAEARMATLATEGLPEKLRAAQEHPRWAAVAERCLGCASCTASCPTCFCSTIEDTTDLGGEVAQRVRRWDSCFTDDFSYIHGGSVRPSLRARYRQWLTHKLSSWHDQFGSSGCVGCGRCTTWCPVGIDIKTEATAIAGGG